jgi:hypothetical protein
MSGIVLVEDFRDAIQARNRRRAIRGAVLTLGGSSCSRPARCSSG